MSINKFGSQSLKTLLLSLFVASSFIQAPLLANTNSLSLKPNEQEETYTIKFNDISVIELLNYVGRISNKNFIYDEKQLNFNLSVVSDAPSTASEVLSLVVEVLRMNDMVVTEEGRNILVYIKTDGETKIMPKIVQEGNPSGEAFITRIFKLKYADPEKIKEVITGIATDSQSVQINADTRHVIVADLAINVQRIGDLIKLLDQIESKIEIDIYKVKHANISALKSFAQKIIDPLTSEDTSGITIIPNLSTNSLYIIASRQYIDKTLNVLNSLDVPSELEIIAKSRARSGLTNIDSTDPSEILDRQINPEFYIYKLQYHTGDDIVTSLKEIVTNMSSDGDSLDPKLAYSISTLQWLASTNSLIFSGDDASIIKLKNLIASLDTPVKQVFIEVLIIDTTITNSLDFGVDLSAQFTWADKGVAGAFSNAGNSSSLATNVNTAHEAQSATPPTTADTGFNLGVVGRAVTHKGNMYTTIGGLIRALDSENDSNIVFNPKILTEDNVTANFFVGEKARIKTNVVVNNGTTSQSNFEVVEIGTTLKVTPTVSHDHLVTLDVVQEQSTALDTGDSSDATALVPLSTTSSTTTRMHVADQHFLMMSGMVQDSKSTTEVGLPFLSRIPFIGRLFKHTVSSDKKRNLIFFIRPHIIHTPNELQELTERHKDLVKLTKGLPEYLNDDIKLFDTLEYEED